MELYQLTTFRTIAALGSFSQAAEVLGYAQSTVSDQIKNLETELQTDLFKRAGSKKVVLTPAGEALLKHAEKMSDIEQEIKIALTQPSEAHGTLTMRIPETVSIHYLPPLISLFKRQFPKVKLEMNNCSYFGLAEELKAGIIDLGFLIADSYDSPELITETICPVPLLMVTHPSHAEAVSSNEGMYQLLDEPLILPSNDCSYVHTLEKILMEHKVKIPLVWHLNSMNAIIQTMVHGVGYSVLPEAAVKEEVKAGRLIVIPWTRRKITASLLMICQRNKWQPPVQQSFMQMIRDEFFTPISDITPS